MRSALVVYESMYGNTQQIALAVAEGLSASLTVTVTEVGDAAETIPADIGLVVVGGPTHAFGMTRPATRSDAATKAGRAVISARRGIREWIEQLAPGSSTAFATFDTRVYRPRVPGSAAKKARKALASKGLPQAADPETFYVMGADGPLKDGERDRAKAWGERLAAQLVQAEATAAGGSRRA